MTKAQKILMVVVCFFLIPVAASLAQEVYPNKPIQIIVPYPPGGTSDLISRILAEKMREYLGQPVIVVNKPGATGAIGLEYVITSKPDGYTIYSAGGTTFSLLHLMMPNITYTINDLSAIGGFAKFPDVNVVYKDLPVNSLAEFIDYAKKHPGTLSWGTTGHGSIDHLAFEVFKIDVKIPRDDIPHIPYAGAAPAITALLGKQVQVCSLPLSAAVASQLEAGGLRAFSVSTSKRSPFRPEIPTVSEQGFPQLTVDPYLSFWAPAKTPPAIIKKLGDATRRATEDKEARQKIQQLYHEPEFLDPQALQKHIEGQVAKWGPVIKRLNISIK
jgi:tripartite-type tricarboxylate transporter receptor subunit TctC